jgi:hypothetical protein
MALNGSTVLIADNRRAFFFAMMLSMIGPLAVLAASTARLASISPFAFVVLQGLGLYLPYIAVHTTIFERLIAMTRDRGNIGFLMYLADAFGYLGYVAVLLTRNMIRPGDEFLSFYLRLSTVLSIACVAILIPCWRYFALHPATQPSASPSQSPVITKVDPWVEAENRG